MNKGAVAATDIEKFRLVITGADLPYSQGWWETDPVRLVEEVIYPDGSVDRWENGLPVMPRAAP